MDFRLPIPKNWQDFESICHRLWQDIWVNTNAKKHGRQGQSQWGVDIYGKPIFSSNYHGVQCKDKDGRLGSQLTQNDLESEAIKANDFKPLLESFTMATTSPRDQKIQEFYRELNENKQFPFEVNVWSWDDIETEIAYRPAILEHFYPKLLGFYETNNRLKLNRFSTKDHLDAFFSRPGLEESFSKQFKSYLRPLIHELAENVYEHGKGSEFQIEVEQQKIILKDNGLEFNPLKDLNPDFVSSSGNVGSFVMSTFLKRFSEKMNCNYLRQDDLNILEFSFEESVLKLNDDNFFEMKIDLQLVYGRLAMRELVKDIPSDKNEIIVIVEEMGALSSFIQFVKEALLKINESQRLILSLPRHEYLHAIGDWFKDDRLIIKMR